MKRERALSKPLVRAEGVIDMSAELPVVPIAVDLGERAIALEAIMEYLNRANRVAGGRKQLESGGGKMGARYGRRAEKIQQGAEKSRDELIEQFRRGISVLAAEDALRANGFDEADIELEVISMQARINQEVGVGHAYAPARAAIVRKARKAAGN